MAIAEACQNVEIVTDILAGQDAGGPITITAFYEPVITLNFDPVEVLSCDEVRHPGNRVGPVCHGRTIFQQLNPLQREQRQEVGIDQTITRRNKRAMTVQQDQSAYRAKIAQID